MKTIKKKHILILAIGLLLSSCVVEQKYLYHERGKDYWVTIEEYYELKYQKGVELNKWNPDICPSPKDYAERWKELTLKNSKPKKNKQVGHF